MKKKVVFKKKKIRRKQKHTHRKDSSSIFASFYFDLTKFFPFYFVCFFDATYNKYTTTTYYIEIDSSDKVRDEF